jgi:hypothetical protein
MPSIFFTLHGTCDHPPCLFRPPLARGKPAISAGFAKVRATQDGNFLTPGVGLWHLQVVVRTGVLSTRLIWDHRKEQGRLSDGERHPTPA